MCQPSKHPGHDPGKDVGQENLARSLTSFLREKPARQEQLFGVETVEVEPCRKAHSKAELRR